MATLMSALDNASEFKVLHFAMHGYEGKNLVISYTSDLGTERYLSSNRLWNLIGDSYCVDGRVQCIFINACESKSIADSMNTAGFGGAIVSWEETVKNTIAADFARAFYAYLGRTKSLDFRKAFEDAKHVAEVLVHTKHEAKREQNKEWFVGNGSPYFLNSGNEITSNDQFDERSCPEKHSLISHIQREQWDDALTFLEETEVSRKYLNKEIESQGETSLHHACLRCNDAKSLTLIQELVNIGKIDLITKVTDTKQSVLHYANLNPCWSEKAVEKLEELWPSSSVDYSWEDFKEQKDITGRTCEEMDKSKRKALLHKQGEDRTKRIKVKERSVNQDHMTKEDFKTKYLEPEVEIYHFCYKKIREIYFCKETARRRRNKLKKSGTEVTELNKDCFEEKLFDYTTNSEESIFYAQREVDLKPVKNKVPVYIILNRNICYEACFTTEDKNKVLGKCSNIESPGYNFYFEEKDLHSLLGCHSVIKIVYFQLSVGPSRAKSIG